MAYLDHAATTPLRPEAATALVSAEFGNPSSLHANGRAARRALEEARESLAGDLGVAPGSVIFTSGGTEADNLALAGIFRARRSQDPGRRIVAVSSIEHHAVLDTAAALRTEGAEVVELAVTAAGRVELAEVAALLAARASEVAVVSVMSANNETGARQPINEIATALAGTGIPLHVDAVQSVGPGGDALPATAAFSVSAHKFGGPVGVGALVLPTSIPCAPVTFGGGQERSVRSGTLNVAGAVAMAAALRAARRRPAGTAEPDRTMADLRDQLAVAVLAAVPDAVINTPLADALPGILNVGFPGCEGDALLMLLDAAGIQVSTGSACTAGVPRPSHVLLAAGQGDAAASSALRFSFGWTSREADVAAVAAVLPEIVARARRAAGSAPLNPAGPLHPAAPLNPAGTGVAL